FRDRTTLRNQHINLPQLGDDLFRRVSLPCHSSVLHQAISHTSGRTTSQGADQKSSPPESWATRSSGTSKSNGKISPTMISPPSTVSGISLRARFKSA